MNYVLGVDLGTTYTAAAVWVEGSSGPEMVELGDRSAAIPSVVFVREDGSIIIGEPAQHRSLDDPSRVAREFKRRLGDSIPVLVGGSPWSAEALLGELLRQVVATVANRFGAPPSRMVLSHPANWGPYRV